MSGEDWNDRERRTFGMQLGYDAPDRHRLLLLLNAAPDRVNFHLPPVLPPGPWTQLFDTTRPAGLVDENPAVLVPPGAYPMEPRSLVVFHSEASGEGS